MGLRYIRFIRNSLFVILVVAAQTVRSLLTINTLLSSQAVACTTTLITWSGGQAPYTLHFIVQGQNLEIVSIPSQTTSFNWNVDIAPDFPIVLSITDSSSPQQVAETSSFVTSGGTSCKLKFPVSDSVPLDSLPSPIPTSANTFSFISSNTALTIASLPTENSLPVSTLSTSTSGSAHGATVTAHTMSNQPSQTGDQSPGLSNSPSSRTSPAIFIGIIIGVTSLIVIAVIIFVLFRRRQRQRQFRQTVDLLADPQTPAMRTVYTDTLPQPDQSESLVHPQTSQDTPQLAVVIPDITVWTQTPENKGQHDIRTRPLPLSSPRKGNASNITQHPSASGQGGSITTINYRDGDTSMTNLIVRREADAGVTLAGGRDIEEILPPAYGDF